MTHHTLIISILLIVITAATTSYLYNRSSMAYKVYVDVIDHNGTATSTSSLLNQNEELTLTNTHFEQPATTTETVRIYKQHCTVVRDDDLVTDYDCY